MTRANCQMRKDTPRATDFAVEHGLAVRSLARSIAFYGDLFGFRVVTDVRHEPERYVIMTAPGQACIILREEQRLGSQSALSSMSSADRQPGERALRPLRMVVGDIDETRARLWDNGAPLARGTREPGEAGHGRRSLQVDDPDGRRIELVERQPLSRSRNQGSARTYRGPAGR